MRSGTRDHERMANHRGRTTVLVLPLIAFAAWAAAMLLGHEEALGLMVLALLAVASEVIRPPRGEKARSKRW